MRYTVYLKKKVFCTFCHQIERSGQRHNVRILIKVNLTVAKFDTDRFVVVTIPNHKRHQAWRKLSRTDAM